MTTRYRLHRAARKRAWVDITEEDADDEMRTFVAGYSVMKDGIRRRPWFGQVVGKRVCDTIGPVIKSGFPKNTEIYEVRVFAPPYGTCAPPYSHDVQWVVSRELGEVYDVYAETVVEVQVKSRTNKFRVFDLDMNLFPAAGTYDAYSKMTDKDKLRSNREFADQVGKLAFDVPNVVVLDAETLLSSRIVHKRVPRAKITAVSKDAEPTIKVPNTTFKGGFTLAEVLAGLPGTNYNSDQCVDAFFLDHCGFIDGEVETLEAAFVSLRHGHPCIIAATYCFRKKGGVAATNKVFMNTLHAKLQHYIAEGQLTNTYRIDLVSTHTYPKMCFIMVRVETQIESGSDIFC